jgi:cobalamin biosynthesis protein CobD/CbiB
MAFSLVGICRWLERTPWSPALRDSIWMYPIVESVHLLALCLFLGFAVLLDLRLLGIVFRQTPVVDMRLLRLGLQEPVRRLAREVEPWMVGALVVIVASGTLLFLSEALKCYDNLAFRAKMVALFLAILFTFTVRRRVTLADEGRSPTWNKWVAATSIGLWSIVGFAGRGIGFY